MSKHNRKRIMLVLCAGLLLMGACQAILAQSTREKQNPPQTETASGTCTGTFNGVWDTQYGRLTLSVAANGEVRASWLKKDIEHQPWGPDIINAKVNGKVLSGQYKNNGPGEGDFEFDLADDGKSFTGAWTKKSGSGGDAGPWWGRCVPTDLRTRDKSPKPLVTTDRAEGANKLDRP